MAGFSFWQPLGVGLAEQTLVAPVLTALVRYATLWTFKQAGIRRYLPHGISRDLLLLLQPGQFA
jgi:hypothetical protein